MKVFKLYDNRTKKGVNALNGLKVLYDDGVSRNDLQTAMAVMQWVNTMEVIEDIIGWLWDDGTQLCWDDGTPIL